MSKRKAHPRRPLDATKKIKVQHGSLDKLPWKSVARPVETVLDGDDGILELEEVDNVEVVYEEKDGGKVIKFNVLQPPDITAIDESSAADGEPPASLTEDPQQSTTASFDAALLPKWRPFSLQPQLLQVLHMKSFTTPTPIQSRALPFALSNRDVVGVAETGSGKTLAYGLPILHRILSQPRRPSSKRSLQALILAPTRELALQVSDHLSAFSRAVSATLKDEPQEVDLSKVEVHASTKCKGQESKNRNTLDLPLVSVAVLVGGMSAQKQRRILNRGVDVLIATPGRLWDTLEEVRSVEAWYCVRENKILCSLFFDQDEILAQEVRNLKVLVLDEADRMIEAGHFAEMDNILRLTVRQSKQDEIEPELKAQESNASPPPNDNMQTFVFSATLSKDLQRNLKRRSRPKPGKNGNSKPLSTLDDLLLRLDFRDPTPEIIDLSPDGGAVSTLQESKVECLASEKDAHLYYFLLRYPGRSLVFLSAIDGIRRLAPLLELLDLHAFPLHSQLEQRQRLKNLDRFKLTPNSILLATDIAARGLDIPAIDHVIHYQVPRSADVFIHRNGRTARAMHNGFSLLMCSPDERRTVRALFSSLGRQDTDIPDITIELTLLDHLKERVRLARQIDVQHHRAKKQNHERRWLKEAAEAMEIELDSDIMSGSDDEGRATKHERKRINGQTAVLRAELKEMLSRPLIARGVSTRYITSGSRPIADDILGGKGSSRWFMRRREKNNIGSNPDCIVHETMLGLARTDARSDLVSVHRSRNATVDTKQEEDPEEWAGIGF
ncbi:ATP-dependent RNA helicase [Boletus reticuloceps]|uniref:RNA helicase n=1 Tax=Boletus reticuloceps TaxID=495285 RepID=A0A8I3ACR9_9AGAM|nr:ATP-dependent RNA helicase [Boletus reticuloceps]